MATRKYKHLTKTTLTPSDIAEYERTNLAYQDKLGTQNTMQSPYTLDVDETKVTNRRSAYPTLETQEYFSGANYNLKTKNMNLSSLVSAKMRERTRPELQPGQIIDPSEEEMPQYTYTAKDDTHILLYLGAFVVGIIIFTSLM